MPELPEVETVRRALEMHVRGRRVLSVEAKPVQLRRPLDPERLGAALTGAQLDMPRRRGKHLLVDVAERGTLMVHLGMTGRLVLAEPDHEPPRHTHLTLGLDSGRVLRFVDPRRFGLVHWLEPGQEAHDPSLVRLGLEPLDPDLPLLLPQLLRSRRAPVKSLLLDQHLVAGVGNIYANEALWRAGITPDRAGSKISTQRLSTLARVLREVLTEAIAAGGTTIRDFASLGTEAGMFAIRLRVYGRDGEPCPTCATLIRRSVLAGRSTFFCPRCQR